MFLDKQMHNSQHEACYYGLYNEWEKHVCRTLPLLSDLISPSNNAFIKVHKCIWISVTHPTAGVCTLKSYFRNSSGVTQALLDIDDEKTRTLDWVKITDVTMNHTHRQSVVKISYGECIAYFFTNNDFLTCNSHPYISLSNIIVLVCTWSTHIQCLFL